MFLSQLVELYIKIVFYLVNGHDTENSFDQMQTRCQILNKIKTQLTLFKVNQPGNFRDAGGSLDLINYQSRFQNDDKMINWTVYIACF